MSTCPAKLRVTVDPPSRDERSKVWHTVASCRRLRAGAGGAMFSDAREAADSLVGEAQADQLLGDRQRHVAGYAPEPRLRCKGKQLVLGL